MDKDIEELSREFERAYKERSKIYDETKSKFSSPYWDYEEDPDDEIRDFLIELNTKGYVTTWSCAGHSEAMDWNKGFVHFASTPESGSSSSWTSREQAVVKRLARQYGISRVRFFSGSPKHGWVTSLGGEEVTPQNKGITFSPVGGPYSTLYDE